MFGVLGTEETTFKAEWHRLKWPSATRPPSATFVWAEAGLETHGSNDWNRNTWNHGCKNELFHNMNQLMWKLNSIKTYKKRKHAHTCIAHIGIFCTCLCREII